MWPHYYFVTDTAKKCPKTKYWMWNCKIDFLPVYKVSPTNWAKKISSSAQNEMPRIRQWRVEKNVIFILLLISSLLYDIYTPAESGICDMFSIDVRWRRTSPLCINSHRSSILKCPYLQIIICIKLFAN